MLFGSGERDEDKHRTETVCSALALAKQASPITVGRDSPESFLVGKGEAFRGVPMGDVGRGQLEAGQLLEPGRPLSLVKASCLAFSAWSRVGSGNKNWGSW